MKHNPVNNKKTQIAILKFCNVARSGQAVIDAISNESEGRLRMFLTALSIAGYLQALGETRGRTYHTTHLGREHLEREEKRVGQWEEWGLE